MPNVPLLVFPCRRLLDYYVRGLRIDISRNAVVIPHVGWGGSLAHRDHDDTGPIRLVYVGALRGAGRASAAVRFLEGFRKAADARAGRYPKAELLFVGDDDPEVRSEVSRLRLEDIVSVLPPVSYEESLRLMSGADALVLVEGEFEEGIFLPSKFCDYAATGKPVLMYSPEIGTIADMIGGAAHPGFMNQSIDGAASVLVRFLNDCAAGRDLSAYRVAADDFSPHRVAAQFLDALQRIL
jgi:glycosyltransferase involved in cell wall biosynthesis